MLKGALGVPVPGLVIALFVVFGGGPMGVSGKLVLFRGSPMSFVHGGLFSCQPRRERDRLARGPLVATKATTIGGEEIGSRARAGISRRPAES